MSRYLLDPLATADTITAAAIGWDRPLESFFVQVFAGVDSDGEDNVILWTGTSPGELPTAAAAIALVQPYAAIPEDLNARLETDRLKTIATPATDLQRRMRLSIRPRK